MATATMRRWLRVSVAALGLMAMGGVLAQATPGTAASSSGAGVKSVTNARAATTASASASTSTASAVTAFTPLESYALLAQSASEGIAVLRSPDRQLITLRVGSVLTPAKARLVLIQGGLLKFEAVDDKGVRQIAWVKPGAKPEDPVQVQRVNLDAPPQPLFNRPVEAQVAAQPNKNSK